MSALLSAAFHFIYVLTRVLMDCAPEFSSKLLVFGACTEIRLGDLVAFSCTCRRRACNTVVSFPIWQHDNHVCPDDLHSDPAHLERSTVRSRDLSAEIQRLLMPLPELFSPDQFHPRDHCFEAIHSPH